MGVGRVLSFKGLGFSAWRGVPGRVFMYELRSTLGNWGRICFLLGGSKFCFYDVALFV